MEVLEREGEPTSLIDAWEGAERVVARRRRVLGRASPERCTASTRARDELPARLFDTSTHHFGLAEAVELARALGRLPRNVIVYGIEGKSFETGETLSPEVGRAAHEVADAIREEVAECTKRC